MSNIASVRIGDHVRITEVWEGVLTGMPRGDFELDGDERTIYRGHASKFTVEVLEPAYEHNVAYIDADGDIFLREDGEKSWMSFDGVSYGENYPTRPLRKLVPEATGA